MPVPLFSAQVKPGDDAPTKPSSPLAVLPSSSSGAASTSVGDALSSASLWSTVDSDSGFFVRVTDESMSLLQAFLEKSVGAASESLIREIVAIAARSAPRTNRKKKDPAAAGGAAAAAKSNASYELYETMPPEGLGFGTIWAAESKPPSSSSSSSAAAAAARVSGGGVNFPPSASRGNSGSNGSYYNADVAVEDMSDDDDLAAGDQSDDEETGVRTHPAGRRRSARPTANVPRLDNLVILDASGEFIPMPTIRRKQSVRSSNNETSFKMEDSIMDRRKKLSFVQISIQEKRDVFRLPAVRRSMRHLNYAQILMTDEALELANKYMEMGPTRASLLQIGYSSVQVSNAEKSFVEECGYISPLFKALSVFGGYHWATWTLNLFFSLCDFAFFGLAIYREGNIDAITGPVLVSIFFFLFFNQSHCFSTAFTKIDLAADTPLDAMHLTGTVYLQLKGLDTLARAQQRLAKEKKRVIPPEADFAVFKKSVVNSTFLEAMTVHFLFGAGTVVASALSTIINSWSRGDQIALVLAVGSVLNKLVMLMVCVHVTFVVRLMQNLAEFEIRRVEADIR